MAEQFTNLESFYSSTLSQSITAAATSIVVATAPTVTDNAFLVIEKNTPNEEIVKMTSRSGTTLTVVRGLAISGSTETDGGLGVAHPAGASIEITDVHYYIKQIQAKATWAFRGDQADLTAIQALANAEAGDLAFARDTGSMYWYNGTSWVTITGGTTPSDASTTVKGITKLSVAPASATNPIAVGDNDGRVPTQAENDALVGTVGTPSSTNKFVTADERTATPTASRIPLADGSGKLASGWLPIVLGGTGADGALSISSGTTTLDFASARYLIKNYTSISITGTAVLTASNPHAEGSTLILLSQGAVTITSSTVPAVDLRLMGGSGGAGGSVINGVLVISVGSPGRGLGGGFGASGFLETNGTFEGIGGGGGGGLNNGTIAQYATYLTAATSFIGRPEGGRACQVLSPTVLWAESGGGGAGGTGGGTNAASGGAGGAGGRGGGGLVIVCGGALNITSTFNVSGAVGTAGTTDADADGGGGGGGAGGSILIIYTTLTANTATFTVAGGAGGAGGGADQAGGAGSDGSSLVVANSFFI